MTKSDPVEGETKGDKSGNHDGTKSNRTKTKGDLKIMTEQDPVEGGQRETNLESMTKQEPVEGRQRETNLEIMTKQNPLEEKLHKHRPQTAFFTFP